MPHRILVVDDEPLVLDAWARSLELEGFVVEKARSAEEALKKCDEDFDLVLLDFLMPGGNGIELLARMRKKLPLIRSVVVSGKLDLASDEAEISRDLKSSVEADVYLHKPVADDKLVATIKELVAEKPDEDWRVIAKRFSNGQQVTVEGAKAAAKKLKDLRKKG
jgi:CheY-like chemotaxis protein